MKTHVRRIVGRGAKKSSRHSWERCMGRRLDVGIVGVMGMMVGAFTLQTLHARQSRGVVTYPALIKFVPLTTTRCTTYAKKPKSKQTNMLSTY